MQASLLNVFVRLSQKALDISRGYGSPPSSLSETEDCRLSDAAFAALLKDIDTFSVQLTQQASLNVAFEKSPTYLLGGRQTVTSPTKKQRGST